jgi:hypothetical protein
MSRSALPAMTVVALAEMIAGWRETAARENAIMAETIEGLTGRAQEFGPGRPVPVCPACGWESAEEDQGDFMIAATGAPVAGYHDAEGPFILFGCGHGWRITEIPPRTEQDR